MITKQIKSLKAIYGNKKHFDAEYSPGALNSDADAISRASVDSLVVDMDDTESYLIAYLQDTNLDSEAITNETLKNPLLSKIYIFWLCPKWRRKW